MPFSPRGGHGEISLHLPHILAWGQSSHLQLLRYSCNKRMLELLVLQWGTFIISLPELVCRGEAHYFSRKSEKEISRAHVSYLASGHMFSLMPSAVSFPYSVIFRGGLHKGSFCALVSAIFSKGISPFTLEIIGGGLIVISASIPFSYVVLYLSCSSYTATPAFSSFMYFSQSLGGLMQ